MQTFKTLILGLAITAMTLFSARALSISETITPGSVDHWDVTVTGHTLIIDVRALERQHEFYDEETKQYSFFDVDLNGDGEFTYLDSYIYLFTTSGICVGSNDDSWNTFGDGSVRNQDSYLSLTGLSLGNYILAIGSFNLTEANAWAKSNPENIGSGDYQITITNVPDAGSSLALLGMSVFFLAAANRGRKQN